MFTSVQYSMDVIKDEVRQLVKKGLVSRQQPIYTISQFFPAREWILVERELENNEFLLRERLIDLLSQEDWRED